MSLVLHVLPRSHEVELKRRHERLVLLMLLNATQKFDYGQNTVRDDVLRIAGEVEMRLVRVGLG